MMADLSSNNYSDSHDESTYEHDDTGKEKRFALTIIQVVIVFTATWIYKFYLRVVQPNNHFGATYYTASTVGLSSSALNPILFCFLNQECRNGLQRICMNFGLTFGDREGLEQI